MRAFVFMKLFALGAAVTALFMLFIDTLDEFASCAGYDYGKSVRRILLIIRIVWLLLAVVLCIIF